MLTIDTRATEPVDRYACLARYQERLRLLHNAEAAKIGQRGGITLPEFRTWERKIWRPKLKHICLEMGNVKAEVRKSAEYRQPKGINADDSLIALKTAGCADSKWDRDFDYDSIEPRGKGITPVDPVQDFTTYTEVDPAGKLSQTSTRATFTALPRNANAYIYKDFGAGHFSGDWEWLYTSVISANSGQGLAGQVGVTNALGSLSQLDDAPPALWTQFFNGGASLTRYSLAEVYAGPTLVADHFVVSATNTYYCRFERDESVGTYGTVYCYFYTDSGRTTLADTLSLALHDAKYDYRYLEATMSYNDANAATTTGYVEDLDLQEAVGHPARKRMGGVQHVYGGYQPGTGMRMW